MSYRNCVGLSAVLLGCAVVGVFSGCGGLNAVKIIVKDDGGSAGMANDNGGRPNVGGANGVAGGALADSGAAGEAGASGASGAGGEAGQPLTVEPDPPTVTAVSPRDSASGVDPTGRITLTFSEPLDPTTVTSSSVQVKDELDQVVTGTLTYKSGVASFKPDARLSLLGDYTVNVSTEVTDAGGTPLSAPFSATFRVRDGAWVQPETPLVSARDFEISSPPSLATDGAGRAIAAWSERSSSGANYEIYAAFYGEGSGWSTATKISENSTTCQLPTVSMNARGDAIVGWLEHDATLGDSIQARRYVVGTWDLAPAKVDVAPADIATTSLSGVSVAISQKGDAHVLWSSLESSVLNSYAVLTRHVDAKGVWAGTPTYLTSPQTGSNVSPAAMDFDAAGNGFAAYQFTSGSPLKTDTLVHRYVAASGRWSASDVGDVESDGDSVAVSVAVSPAGEAVVAWEHNTASTTYEVMASHFNKAWSAPVVISTATTYLEPFPALASSAWTGKGFLVAWSQKAGELGDIYANQYTSSWGRATIVSDGNHGASQPFVEGDGRGNALLLWSQESDQASTASVFPYDIAFSRFTAASSTWSGPGLVSGLFGGYRVPAVTILGDGTALSAWYELVNQGRTSTVDGVLQSGFR